MIKLSNRLIDLDDRMRSFVKAAHNLLMEILHSNDKIFRKKRRRKIDKQLYKLLDYLEKIDSLGYRLKLDIVTKKEVMDKVNAKIQKNREKRKGGKKCQLS